MTSTLFLNELLHLIIYQLMLTPINYSKDLGDWIHEGDFNFLLETNSEQTQKHKHVTCFAHKWPLSSPETFSSSIAVVAMIIPWQKESVS